MFRQAVRRSPRLMLCGWLSLRSKPYSSAAAGAAAPQPSGSNASTSSYVDAGFDPRLLSVFTQVDSLAPRFVLQKGQVTILEEPAVFYEALKEKIAGAKRRVFLSSLYFGKEETELVEVLDRALEANPDLQVSILLDALRGTREAPNPCSASVLEPLVRKHGKHRVDFRLYQTPQLGRFTHKVAPKRLVEGVGLQHMKIYGFDDEIILSGANLSRDYFTDRQDRYYVFSDSGLADYYYDIQHAVSQLSYQVVPRKKAGATKFRLTWPTNNASCEPMMNVERFISDSSHLLTPLLKQHQLSKFESHQSAGDTIVYPISQFTPLMAKDQDTSTEKPVVLRLLSYMDSPKIRWWFTAGYFNMLPQIQDRLLNGKSRGDVITAAPQANSFYKSAGISYYLPQAYLLFAKRFLQQVQQWGKQDQVRVYEWHNGEVNTPGGWSYHAKGIWGTSPNEDLPTFTVVGSSNYTKRAYSCDIETNAVVITKDPELKKAMGHEVDHIMEHAHRLTLADFEPVKTNVKVGDSEHQRLQLPENRQISKGVHVAVKVLSDRL
ncbi:CDP-diacylglycerol--glycerol-3-phosphate 3-phosphatidyltransferase [Diutina catenulata]